MRTNIVARVGSVSLLMLLTASPRLFADDNQIRGFVGATFRGSTTFVDLAGASSKPSFVFGVAWLSLRDVFGVEAELADAPGFFGSGGEGLVLSSRVTTFTGNLVIAAPRRLTEYTLRPYFVGGGGLMHVRIADIFDALPVSRWKPGFDLGVGVMGFFSDRVGVAWEVRRFQAFPQPTQAEGLTFGDERLSFWRGTMALTYRY